MPGRGLGRSIRNLVVAPAHDQYRQAAAPGASVRADIDRRRDGPTWLAEIMFFTRPSQPPSRAKPAKAVRRYGHAVKKTSRAWKGSSEVKSALMNPPCSRPAEDTPGLTGVNVVRPRAAALWALHVDPRYGIGVDQHQPGNHLVVLSTGWRRAVSCRDGDALDRRPSSARSPPHTPPRGGRSWLPVQPASRAVPRRRWHPRQPPASQRQPRRPRRPDSRRR
jgi:hypothetical protein